MKIVFVIISLTLLVLLCVMIQRQQSSTQEIESNFGIDEFNSNDGMMTSIWGPPLWHIMHTISFNYPIKPTEEQKIQYQQFFFDLQNVLPCRYCRDNYKENLTKLPLDYSVMENRETLSRWVFQLHQLVNIRLGKLNDLTYEEVRERYEHFRSRCVKDLTPSPFEKGCTQPFYGKKSKCVINIVPNDTQISSFNIDPQCILKRAQMLQFSSN